ncbi:MAG TPA: hypothetical protein VJ276_05030 [Thermoanaerobaculia bacterium]|nr:hypothetical protein [Thermoanaerobaculia bacterium]
MEKLFSAISGHFARTILIGSVLPATVFVIAFYLFVLPMIPWESHLAPRLEILDPEWRLAAAAGYIVILAGLLHIFNIPIIQLYEGYPWQYGPLGRRMSDHQRRAVEELVRRGDRARELRLDKAKPVTPAQDEELRGIWADCVQRRFFEYPDAEFVLPTRLGNVIRSFEMYPQRQYEISAIPFWPRFAARIKSEHAQMIDGAKALFDVTIHLSFLAGATAALLIVISCIFPTPFLTWPLFGWWAARLGISLCLAWFFYRGSIARAMEWGNLVRSAFDLHRHDVLKDLGFEPPPGDLISERAVWKDLSARFDVGDPPNARELHYDLRTIVLPHDAPMIVTRAAGPANSAGVRTVAIRVHNPRSRPTSDVKIVEHLPEGTELLWGTASVPFTGANPYHFQVPAIAAQNHVVISYRVRERGKG